MANQNGLGGQNATGYNALNGPVTTPAGHYSDMQFLDRNMEALSIALHENRNEWNQIEDLLAQASRLQGRLPRDGPTQLTNGAHSGTAEPDQPSVEQLQSELADANTQLEELRDEHHKIIDMYEKMFEEIQTRARVYGNGVQLYLARTVQHYNVLLDQERVETMNARLEHQAWQAGLQRVSEGVRTALRQREEEGAPWKRRIAALKEENRLLRAKVGWDPPVDSDDEAETGQELGGPREEQRGRPTHSAQGNTNTQHSDL